MIGFSPAFAQENEIQIVLLAGQSNMAGRANYDDLDASLKERIEKVKSRVFLSTSRENSESNTTDNAKEKNSFGLTKSFGPEVFIGLTLAEKYPSKRFLLIKKAFGGTSLYGAWNANWTQEKADESEFDETRKKLQLYKSFIDLVNFNLFKLKAEGKSYKIWGMCWMQGETDTNRALTAQSYEANLKTLITSCRKEFNCAEMPFIIGQINCLGRKYSQGPAEVRIAMVNIAGADLTVGIVKTATDKSWADFPKNDDNLHYNAIGQQRLGIAFANELIEISK